LSEAARICGVSHHTIQRLVEAGLLKREQITPRAPWEVSRRDLDAELIRSVIEVDPGFWTSGLGGADAVPF
jgi:hypothetical protein